MQVTTVHRQVQIRRGLTHKIVLNCTRIKTKFPAPIKAVTFHSYDISHAPLLESNGLLCEFFNDLLAVRVFSNDLASALYTCSNLLIHIPLHDKTIPHLITHGAFNLLMITGSSIQFYLQ